MGQGEHPSKLTQLWLGHRYGQITFLSDDDDYDVLRWVEHRWRLWLWNLNEWMDGRLLLLSCEKGGIWSVLRSDWEWKMRVLFDGSGNGNEEFPSRNHFNSSRQIFDILISPSSQLSLWINWNNTNKFFMGKLHRTMETVDDSQHVFYIVVFCEKKCTILAVLQI